MLTLTPETLRQEADALRREERTTHDSDMFRKGYCAALRDIARRMEEAHGCPYVSARWDNGTRGLRCRLSHGHGGKHIFREEQISVQGVDAVEA